VIENDARMSVSFCTATSDVSLLSGYDFVNWLPAGTGARGHGVRGVGCIVCTEGAAEPWLLNLLKFDRERVHHPCLYSSNPPGAQCLIIIVVAFFWSTTRGAKATR